MAAILCQSMSGLCRSCGTICTLPCRLCSNICQPLCEVTKKAFSSHFCIYTTVTFLLNIPPISFAIQGLTYGSCTGSQWMSVNLMFCTAHIVCAFYLAMQSKSWMDTVKILCYDPWFAVYILVFIAFLIWLCIGLSWSAQGEMANGNCPDNILSLTSSSFYCGFTFIFTGLFALGISSLISMCVGKNHNSSNFENPTTPEGEYKPPNGSTYSTA